MSSAPGRLRFRRLVGSDRLDSIVASGTLPGPLSFDNGTPTNEITQGFTYGSSLSFAVAFSGFAVGTSGPFGSFSQLTLYDGSFVPVPYSTGPNGSIVTIAVNRNGTTTGKAYSPLDTSGPKAVVARVVPEPTSMTMLGIGLGVVLLRPQRRRTV